LVGDAAEQNRRTRCDSEGLRKSLQREVLAGMVDGRSLSLVVLIQISWSAKYTELGCTLWRHHPEFIRSQVEQTMFYWELKEPVLNFIYPPSISLSLF
jgi:hypothetical protein